MTPEDLPENLTETLHRQIPLVAALGARVLGFDGRCLRVTAPLAPNVNHRGVAFGGSLATLGIVAGWALVSEALAREGLAAEVMIHRSECDYAQPVAADFIAVSTLPDADWPRFVSTLRRQRRARIAIDTVISAGGLAAVTHRGSYAAIPERIPSGPTEPT